MTAGGIGAAGTGPTTSWARRFPPRKAARRMAAAGGKARRFREGVTRSEYPPARWSPPDGRCDGVPDPTHRVREGRRATVPGSFSLRGYAPLSHAIRAITATVVSAPRAIGAP